MKTANKSILTTKEHLKMINLNENEQGINFVIKDLSGKNMLPKNIKLLENEKKFVSQGE